MKCCPSPGRSKTAFDDKGAADEAGQGGTEVGDDRGDAAAEGVFKEDLVRGDALGPRGADEILVQHRRACCRG